MFLRQSTAATIEAGPFIGTDGLTESTVLTSQTGRYVVGGSSSSLTPASWSHVANGNYAVGLSTTHTGTVGRLKIVFQSSGTYLPVWREYVVLSQPVYDALFGSTALSTHTAANVASAILVTPANLLATDASGRVDVVKINGTTQTARDLGASVLLSVGTGTGQVNLASGNVPATLASGDFTATMKTSLNAATPASVGSVTAPVTIAGTLVTLASGTVKVGSSPTTSQVVATLTGAGSAANLTGQTVLFQSGVLQGLSAIITSDSINGSDHTLGFTTPLDAAPSAVTPDSLVIGS